MIVQKFNGTINFSSEEGRGSCFEFAFQLQNLDEHEDLSKNDVQPIDTNDLVFNWQP